MILLELFPLLFQGKSGSISWTRAIISSITSPCFQSSDLSSFPVASCSNELTVFSFQTFFASAKKKQRQLKQKAPAFNELERPLAQWYISSAVGAAT
jgi:hypothetical protein